MRISNINTNFPVIFMGVKLLTLHLRVNIDRRHVLRVTLVIRGKNVRVDRDICKKKSHNFDN
jgi:hypothetical protein